MVQTTYLERGRRATRHRCREEACAGRNADAEPKRNLHLFFRV